MMGQIAPWTDQECLGPSVRHKCPRHFCLHEFLPPQKKNIFYVSADISKNILIFLNIFFDQQTYFFPSDFKLKQNILRAPESILDLTHHVHCALMKNLALSNTLDQVRNMHSESSLTEERKIERKWSKMPRSFFLNLPIRCHSLHWDG